MIREKRPIWFLLTTVVLAGSAPGALAQQPPWPNGCSVGLGFYIQQGIDGIFLDACDAHDQCWAECNGLAPPYHGLAHRQQCDTDFLYDMETACALEAAFIVFPAGGFDDAEDFIQHCAGVGATFYAAVASPIATPVYWASQCVRGCNPDGCSIADEEVPKTCGKGFGPGFCYLIVEPPPPPPPNLCELIDCEEYCGTPIGRVCCPGCGVPPVPCLALPGAGEKDLSSAQPSTPRDLEPESRIWNCGC